MVNNVMLVLGSSFVTAVLQWFLYKRKHNANAVNIEKTNDRSEIENYQFIAREWREAAEQWKHLADDYQTKLIENSHKIEELSKEVSIQKGKLTKAYKRIGELEKHEKLDK